MLVDIAYSAIVTILYRKMLILEPISLADPSELESRMQSGSLTKL
jgi:hypothetical protein